MYTSKTHVANRLAGQVHVQFDGHASESGVRHVRPVHQADAVHQAQRQHETDIDLPLDPLVIGLGELVEDGVTEAIVAAGARLLPDLRGVGTLHLVVLGAVVFGIHLDKRLKSRAEKEVWRRGRCVLGMAGRREECSRSRGLEKDERPAGYLYMWTFFWFVLLDPCSMEDRGDGCTSTPLAILRPILVSLGN